MPDSGPSAAVAAAAAAGAAVAGGAALAASRADANEASDTDDPEPDENTIGPEDLAEFFDNAADAGDQGEPEVPETDVPTVASGVDQDSLREVLRLQLAFAREMEAHAARVIPVLEQALAAAETGHTAVPDDAERSRSFRP